MTPAQAVRVRYTHAIMSLSPSQRVLLVKEIASRLSVEGWSIIDLTLSEFGFPTTDQWSGSSENYVVDMVKVRDDNSLLALAKHLGFDKSDSPSYLKPAFWTDSQLKVFLSHLSSQKTWVSELQVALSTFGISAFVAHKDIRPTLEWQGQIETALATCDSLVALLHEGFHKSNWTDQEIGFAMGRGVAVFSVRFGQDPYGFIGKTQAFQGNGKTAQNLAKELFDAFRSNKQTQGAMAEVLLQMFIRSNTFAQATQRIKLLEELETWGTDFADRIREAVNNNEQISYSWGVPLRVESLAKKWEQP
jgi:hypothetical protein